MLSLQTTISTPGGSYGLTRLIAALGRSSIGLFGFSIGGLISLIDLRKQVHRFAQKPTLIMHGLADDQAQCSWMQPFSHELTKLSPSDHAQCVYPHVRHRLTGADNDHEAAELIDLRRQATHWLLAKLDG